MHGARLSLSVGFVAVATAGIAGTILGLVSGYFGGAVDMVIMRIMDIMMAFPSMLLAIAIVAIRGTGLFNTIVAISVVGIPGYARLVRSMVLTLREQDFILAARMTGVRTPTIILRHILPNSLSPIDRHRHPGYWRGDPVCGGAGLFGPGRPAACAGVGADDQRWGALPAPEPPHGVLPWHGDHAHRAELQPAGRRPAGCARSADEGVAYMATVLRSTTSKPVLRPTMARSMP